MSHRELEQELFDSDAWILPLRLTFGVTCQAKALLWGLVWEVQISKDEILAWLTIFKSNENFSSSVFILTLHKSCVERIGWISFQNYKSSWRILIRIFGDTHAVVASFVNLRYSKCGITTFFYNDFSNSMSLASISQLKLFAHKVEMIMNIAEINSSAVFFEIVKAHPKNSIISVSLKI